MSYSISVKFSNKEEMTNMKNFILSQSSLMKEMSELKLYFHNNTEYEDIIQEGNELPYSPEEKYLLGFNSSIITYYIWSICTWMSVKSNVRNEQQEPYFYYDDEIILVSLTDKKPNQLLATQDGIILKSSGNSNLITKIKNIINNQTHKNIMKQQQLLLKLNDNWNDYNFKNNINPSKIISP